MQQLIPSRGRHLGRIPISVLGAVALVLLTGLGVWWFTNSDTPKVSVSPKNLPQGKVVSVQELKGYEPRFTEAEKELLRTGPDGNDKASVKAFLLAKAKLEADPLARTQLEQEAIILTDGYGHTPPITADNPQVRSAIDALKSGKNPERLNPRMAPKPFDPVAYKQDSQTYLNVSEPGRVFQSALTAPGVKAIEPVSPYWQNVEQGESIEMAVKAAPGYPVTFTCFDCGAFGNGLTTQTVEADSTGVARVKFLGMPGSVLEANILASSPMSSGRVRFKANTLVYTDGQQVSTADASR